MSPMLQHRSDNSTPIRFLQFAVTALLLAGCYTKSEPVSPDECYPTGMREQVPAGVISNGASSLQDWLEQIPDGQESEYGFDDPSQYAVAELGEPYRIIGIDDVAVLAGETDPDVIITFSNEWYLPIVAEDQMRIVLTLLNESGSWNYDALGQPDLAAELDLFEQAVDRTASSCSTGLLRHTAPAFDLALVSDPERGPLFYPLDPEVWGDEFADLAIGEVEFEVAEFAARAAQLID